MRHFSNPLLERALAACENAMAADPAARRAVIDFTGTSAQLSNNFNAPEPVTRAATLYVFRVMCEAPIPMNAGCLKPLKVIIPPGSMLNPNPPASVVAVPITLSPRCASSSAMAAPMPREAPVTRATWPSNFVSLMTAAP